MGRADEVEKWPRSWDRRAPDVGEGREAILSAVDGSPGMVTGSESESEEELDCHMQFVRDQRLDVEIVRKQSVDRLKERSTIEVSQGRLMQLCALRFLAFSVRTK